MTSLTVSGRVAQVLSSYLSDVFGVMGNGNVYFLDAAEKLGLRFSAVRHEGAAIAAADAYYRTSGRLAAGTTTYGPGYTNALTALAEAVQAQIPVVLVTGDAPTSGARPQDVDQAAIAAGLGAATFTVTRDAAGSITQQAVEYALTKRTAVVIAIPYDLAALEAADEELPAPLAPAVSDDVDGGLGQVARLLAGAKRPLILAGRGAHLAGAGPELRELADRLGALTAGTALALNLLQGDGYLGVAGGFGTDTAAGLMGEADVVLVAGASLSPFTMRFGHLLGPDSTVIQIDAALQPTHPRVDTFVSADVKSAAGRILTMLDGPASPDASPAGAWRAEARKRLAEGPAHHPGSAETPDGRLDPRSLATALDAVLPERRTVVQDGGHFVGWAPMYWRIPRPQDLVMVGTAYQTIGLGLASAVGAARAVEDGRTLVLASGDGGFLMGLSDLESLIGAASSAVVVIYNDAAYGAEIHQYGSQGLTEKPMLIPEVDFSGVARALGAESAIIRSLADLSALTGLDRRRRQGNLRGRLPDHLQRPGPVAERVDGGLAGREGGGGRLTEFTGPRATLIPMKAARDARSAAVVINAGSRRGASHDLAVDAMRKAGVPISAVHHVLSGADLAGTLDRVLADGHDLVVVGGGDGTVSYAAGRVAGTNVMLGVLPLGTANDFARTLEIPNNLAEACATVAEGKVVDIDLGRANGEPFLNVASVGLSVAVTEALSPRLKRYLGPLAYSIATLRAYARHKPFRARLEFPEGDHEPLELDDLLQVAVGNGRHYGGGNTVSPTAGIDDHILDIYAILAGPAAGAREHRAAAQGRKLHQTRPGVPPDHQECPAGHRPAAAGEPRRRDRHHHAHRLHRPAQRRPRGGAPEQHQRTVRRTGRRGPS